MTQWLSIVFGIAGGAFIIAGAVHLAFQPYFRGKPVRPWMPEQRERADEGSITGVNAA